MNRTGSANTVCPFYLRESTIRIYCESCCKADGADISTVLTFADEAQKHAYQQAHCFRMKCRCDIAKQLYEKYQ